MAEPQLQFHANGKLLLSGEYVVLSGALALSLPTQRGQSLIIRKEGPADSLLWTSLAEDGNPWFKGRFSVSDWEILEASDKGVAQRLQQLLKAASRQNPEFSQMAAGCTASTRLEFPANWGLGSSSTLVWLLSKWSRSNAWKLLSDTFGGSGYDLAAAAAEGPIFYQLRPEPHSEQIDWNPPFRDQLYFVYLEEKQNSREGIARYRQRSGTATEIIPQISSITRQLVDCHALNDFETLLKKHEKLISELLDLPTVQESRFPDFQGTVKSLGAWGGDFILATDPANNPVSLRNWFSSRGYPTVLSWSEMIRD